MQSDDQLKELVRQRYSSIALQDKGSGEGSCCGSVCCGPEVYNIMSDDYSHLEGYNPDADLGLGCGLPTQFAKIKEGDVVIDLGSGAGNDCFIARSEAGPGGKIIGIDFSEAMIERARSNAEARGLNNVEFRFGDIENMPVSSNVADVVVSNCVLNLLPNKHGIFNEISRVLKPGGHFSISDVVLIGELPGELRSDAEMYSGCISGAIQKVDYLKLIEASGFINITVQKEKVITLPDEILGNYLEPEQLLSYREGAAGIFSITVYAEKPAGKSCCDPACCA
ncbi:MAG TPA: arsenite methyltransferase [Flavitalea sp.]|nr:arsenite methyltransferase [Flavitalea sp.]